MTSKTTLLFLYVLSVGTVLASASPNATDRECFDDTFCIVSVVSGDSVLVSVQSLIPWEVTVSLDMTLENMIADRPLPVVKTVGAHAETTALLLLVDDPGFGWTYHFDLKWLPGSMDARHDDSYTYALPYAAGHSYLVGQGFNGTTTHAGKNAIDWDMPENTGIRAARGGLVIDLEESYTTGGVDPALRTQANFVRIMHEDGTIGTYVHLRKNGVRVSVADRVDRGELIAWSGNTGYSSGPHLHFEVYSLTPELTRSTIPIRFNVKDHLSIELKEGTYYER